MAEKWELLYLYDTDMYHFTPKDHKRIIIKSYIEEKTGKGLTDNGHGSFIINKNEWILQRFFVIPYLLADGWEPYALHGSDDGRNTVDCFRRRNGS